MDLLTILHLMFIQDILCSAAFRSSDIDNYHNKRSDEYSSCTIPLEMIQSYKDYLGQNYCEKISEKHGVCARNITALYSYSQPLIYYDYEHLRGTLKGMEIFGFLLILFSNSEGKCLVLDSEADLEGRQTSAMES